MSQDMSWVFRLMDGMSGPASKIAAAVKKTADQLEAAAGAEKKFTQEQSRAVNTQARIINAYARFTTALTKLSKAQGAARTEQEKLNAAQARSAKIAAQVAREQSRAAKAAADARAAESRAARAASGGGGGGGGSKGWWQTGMGIAGWYVSFRAAEAMVERLAHTVAAIPKAVIGGGIEHTAMKEATVAGMSVVLGDKGKANDLVKEAIRFAAITPMTTEESIKGYQQLVMGGLAPNKVMGVMSAISDLSSINMDKRAEAVSNIARDIMEVQASGKVTGRHLMNLSNWGLPREELYAQLAGGIIPALKGASKGDVADAIHKGKVSAEAFFYAFEQTMAKKGGGMLGGISAVQSQTMSGLWSTLLSRPQELLMNMDQTPAWEKLKTSLSNLVNALDYNTPTGARIQQALSDAFSRWVNALTSWLSDPAKVEQWITKLLKAFDQIVPAFETASDALSSIAENLGSVASALGIGKKFVKHVYGALGVVPEIEGQAWDAGSALVRGILGSDTARGLTGAYQDITGGKAERGVPAMLRPNGEYNFNISVQGATKEDAKAVAAEVHDKVASVLEALNMQQGLA